jgi:hypothetical protein
MHDDTALDEETCFRQGIAHTFVALPPSLSLINNQQAKWLGGRAGVSAAGRSDPSPRAMPCIHGGEGMPYDRRHWSADWINWKGRRNLVFFLNAPDRSRHLILMAWRPGPFFNEALEFSNPRFVWLLAQLIYSPLRLHHPPVYVTMDVRGDGVRSFVALIWILAPAALAPCPGASILLALILLSPPSPPSSHERVPLSSSPTPQVSALQLWNGILARFNQMACAPNARGSTLWLSRANITSLLPTLAGRDSFFLQFCFPMSISYLLQ